jgi:uncharacterized protein (DUF1786 family)
VKQILAIDIGTGTQDIFLLQVGLNPENGLKLVMPSPTMRIRQEIREVTRRGEPLLLTGVTMGGGPCHWAAEDHLKAGLALYATPEAARTFNDDLEWVEREMGITLLSAEEAAQLQSAAHIELRDLDPPAIRQAFKAFGFTLSPDVLGVAVFDHGAAPPNVSDRKFRFDLLTNRLSQSRDLASFAFTSDTIPPEYTRMHAVRQSAKGIDCPKIFMDTAPAAILGATLDPIVASRDSQIIANLGNYHTLAFRLGPDGVDGLFEHHTGELDRNTLEIWLQELANGTISNKQVFNSKGHGALVLEQQPLNLHDDQSQVTITGPRRAMMLGSKLRPHFAVPLGDVMLSGCFGLLLAAANHLPEWRIPILESLSAQASTTPWDLH